MAESIRLYFRRTETPRPDQIGRQEISDAASSRERDLLSGTLDHIPSPLTDAGLTKQVAAIEDYLDNLAPPNGALDRSSLSPSSFWILMYGTWHFRLTSKRFLEFCDRHGWNADPGKGELALGNLLLHALQSLELLYRWNARQVAAPSIKRGAHGHQ